MGLSTIEEKLNNQADAELRKLVDQTYPRITPDGLYSISNLNLDLKVGGEVVSFGVSDLIGQIRKAVFDQNVKKWRQEAIYTFLKNVEETKGQLDQLSAEDIKS